MGDLALQRSLSDVVAEYEHKLAAIPAALAEFNRAGDDLKMDATIGGAATASGIRGAATASGYSGAAIATGRLGRARAAEGSAIFLIHRDKNWKIVAVWAGIAGQDGIKPNTWYELGEDGLPVECEGSEGVSS